MEQLSGVGVLDKAALVLTAVETSPASLGDLVARTGLTRATAHRLAVALEVHRLVGRDPSGRFVPGPRLAAGGAAPLPWALLAAAAPVLAHLRDATGESTQLYVRRGDVRVCVAAAERASGLRDTVPVGTMLPMTAGSGAQVLLAFGADPFPGRDARALPTTGAVGRAEGAPAGAAEPPAGAVFGASTLERVRRRGWAESVGEREAGLASVSAPVRDATGRVVAALSLSGPVERLTRSPGQRHGAAVAAAAERLSG
ncbi:MULTISPECIES: IclR family transcriptional regulator [Protofrankia]|uniref:IclR family transcriptional regulator n=1 Tax=Protofrankia coriariae TaxID=1562887 RepID=A0ABR5F7Y5_9ACTN|nr:MULTISPECIES: IclR family transcriptional regulator C-terminal domain-containing protein [Protofrankia]KLL12834.1 IclR family transcriptional regulator [Protofrankia coriariae]ONH36320.1 IclR family transcriptional regulator [Protofrankia sp. BMG5.30]